MATQTVLRHFYGVREEELSCKVTIDGEPLNPRLDLRNHSPTGFEWGYGGSGPAQLALAILCEATGDDVFAQLYYQDFKFQVVSRLNRNAWTLSQSQVIAWVEADAERAAFMARN